MFRGQLLILGQRADTVVEILWNLPAAVEAMMQQEPLNTLVGVPRAFGNGVKPSGLAVSDGSNLFRLWFRLGLYWLTVPVADSPSTSSSTFRIDQRHISSAAFSHSS